MLDGLYVIAACFYTTVILLLWRGLIKLKRFVPVNHSIPSVTVIIPARNEEMNIRACLDALVKQTYSNYEIIVVDDQSTDGTLDIVRQYEAKHDNIRIIELESKSISPKKAAIDVAVRNTTSELIFTTDADCIVSSEWLSTMTAYFDSSVVAAASWLLINPVEKLSEHVEALDSFSFVLIGAAALGLNRPILANGANFAYRRSAFMDSDGFSESGEFGSGDDDLLLQKMARIYESNCVFVNDLSAAVYTSANRTLGDFFHQRFRWASKFRLYSLPGQLFLSAVYVSIFLLVAGPLFCLWTPLLSIGAFAFFLLAKILADYFFIRKGYHLINKKPNMIYFITAEVVQNLYILIVGIGGPLGRYKWKGRTYRKGKRRQDADA